MSNEHIFHLHECPEGLFGTEAEAKFGEMMARAKKVVEACSWTVRKRSQSLFIFSASPNPKSEVGTGSLEYALWEDGLLRDEPAGFSTSDSVVESPCDLE